MKFFDIELDGDLVEVELLTYQPGSPDCLTGSPDNWSEGSDYIIEFEIRDNDGWIATEQYDRLLVETAIHEYMDRFYS